MTWSATVSSSASTAPATRSRTHPFTEDSLSYMLERFGVNVQGEEIKPKNVAAVLVTATLPSFSRSGSSVDVTVASIGDAKEPRRRDVDPHAAQRRRQ
jgi:flagellar basal body P-ring protein FlgI